jgi:hypothetical protein
MYLPLADDWAVADCGAARLNRDSARIEARVMLFI